MRGYRSFYQEKGTELSSAGIQVIANNPLFTVLEQQVTFWAVNYFTKNLFLCSYEAN